MRTAAIVVGVLGLTLVTLALFLDFGLIPVMAGFGMIWGAISFWDKGSPAEPKSEHKWEWDEGSAGHLYEFCTKCLLYREDAHANQFHRELPCEGRKPRG